MEEQLLVVPLRAVCWPAKLGNCGGVEEFSVVVADTIHLRADLFLVHVFTLGPGRGGGTSPPCSQGPVCQALAIG